MPLDIIHIGQHSQLWIFFAIIGLSFILEDAAIISAAILASNEEISLLLAFSASFLGIFIGDLGLFFLGRLARISRYLRYRLYRYRSIKTVRKSLLNHPISYILALRFAPGLRTVGYITCGFVQLKIILFLFAITLSVFLWVLIITTIIYQISSVPFFANNHFKWLLLPISLSIIYLISKSKSKKSKL